MKKIELSEVEEKNPIVTLADYFFKMPRIVCPLAPLWSDFDPMAVPGVLEWMIVLERKDETLQGHRVRLMGESVKNLFGENLVGKALADALSDSDRAKRWQDLNDVAETREPSFHVSKVPLKQREFITIYRGCFPFCDEERRIIRLIIVAAPTDGTALKKKQPAG